MTYGLKPWRDHASVDCCILRLRSAARCEHIPRLAVSIVTNTLWILGKDGHTMTCVISGEPGHEELRVLLDREVYLSEIHTVHEGAIGRAHILHRGFEAHGWAPAVVTPNMSP